MSDISGHKTCLAALARRHPNSIQIIDSPHPIESYTCLMHVFDFSEKPAYMEIAGSGLGRIFAGADFAHWLIEHSHLFEVRQGEANDDDLVMYFDDGNFRHVGLWRTNGRVVSKWGVGHLYDHELLEVPRSYGDEVKFYRRLEPDTALYLFTQFANES